MLYTVFRKLSEILGRGRMGDPASLTLSVSADPRRVKIARVFGLKALELYRLMGRPAELGLAVSAFRGVERQRVYGSLGRLTRLSASAWSLMVGVPPLFLYKSLSGELPLNAKEASGDGGVYLLIDKSGSMYGAVNGVEKIVVATAYALAVLKSYKRVVVRFFDAEVYELVEDADKLVDVLLRTVASGGTDISRAVEAASRDAETRKLRGYTLAVVTDLEDEKLSMEVIKRAKGIFREVVFIISGHGKAATRRLGKYLSAFVEACRSFLTGFDLQV
jgi:uncharacterized protein with von Willebrand factor type A (vWA) domain